MSSALSSLPVESRRKLSGTLGLFAVLMIAVGAVAMTGPDTAVIKTFVVLAFVAAVVLATTAWGVALSVKVELSERRLDAAVEDAMEQAVAAGASVPSCGCGHEHDPDEIHVTDDPCARDGDGVGCTHSCESCIFSAAQARADRPPVTAGSGSGRPSPRATTRPSPRPRKPSPTPR